MLRICERFHWLAYAQPICANILAACVRLSVWGVVAVCTADGWLLAQVQLTGPNDSQPRIGQRLAAADSARLDLEQSLRSAEATGKYRVTQRDADMLEPFEVVDADLEVHYQSPKFVLRVTNLLRLQEVGDESTPIERRWSRSPVESSSVLFDGEALYIIETREGGRSSGEIYFPFARQAVLRSAGFPFEHPLHLWNEALTINRIKPDRTSFKSLAGGGLIGVETLNDLETRFVFLSDFEYDLRLVSTQRKDDGTPIREFSLRWDEANGAHFLRRFSSSVNRTTTNELLKRTVIQSNRSVEVEFSTFECNQAIPDEKFTLSFLGIPNGTQFTDKRIRTTPGAPTLQFVDGRLAKLNEE